MTFNLVDSVKSLFSNEFIGKAASSLGESESGIQKIVSGAVPSVLVGLVAKASSSDGSAVVLDMAKDAAGSGILGNPSGFLGNNSACLIEKGRSLLEELFGSKLSGIINLLSSHAAVKQSSISSMLSIVTPAALTVLGNHAAGNNLNAGGLMNLLSSQKRDIMSSLPPGLSSITGMVGLGPVRSSVSAVTEDTEDGIRKKVEKSKEDYGRSIKMLNIIFIGLLLVGLLIYLFKGCGLHEITSVSTAEDTTLIKNDKLAITQVMPAEPESIKVKLPNGTELGAYKGGIEDRLVAFLSTDYAKLGADSLKKIWFDFDNLNFKIGSSDITPESQKQVDNIASILKAFPATNIKIGGYTDKTGNEETNKKLSAARAIAVKASLDKAGVASQVTGADGYGSAFAKYPSNVPETYRVKDRHVSVNVRL